MYMVGSGLTARYVIKGPLKALLHHFLKSNRSFELWNNKINGNGYCEIDSGNG